MVVAPLTNLPVKADATYTYTFHGPFYEDGTVPTANVSLALLYINSTIYRFNLYSDGAAYDNETVISTASAYQVLWNVTTSEGSATRRYDFLSSDTTDEINIYIPSESLPSYEYTFTVTDFYGMSNPYLQTSLSEDGTTYNAVERRSITSATVPFVMAQYGTYRLTFICDEGTYSQIFTAETTFSTDLIVMPGHFPSNNTDYVYANTTRLNNTAIQTMYYDPSDTTNWFYYAITHRSGFSTITDYTYNSTGSSQTDVWNNGSALIDYTVNAYAYLGADTYYNWTLAAPIPVNQTNPWDGLFTALGTWPSGFDADQIPAILIIIAVAAIGSYFSITAGMGGSWIVAGVLMAMGWISIPLPLYGLGGVIVFSVGVLEYKKTEREL